MTIKEALESLDPSDDALWLDDGMPKLDAIAGKMGVPSVTRSEVTKAWPSFNRGAAKVSSTAKAAKAESGPTDDTEATTKGQGGAKASPASPEVSEADVTQNTPSETEQGDAEGPKQAKAGDAPMEANDSMLAHDTQIAKLLEERKRIDKEIEIQSQKRNVLHQKMVSENENTSSHVARYFETQDRLKSIKSETRITIPLDMKSPLDKKIAAENALKRKMNAGK